MVFPAPLGPAMILQIGASSPARPAASLASSIREQDQLGAAKHGDRPSSFNVCHDGVPYLCGAPAVHSSGDTRDGPVARRSDEVRLEFHCRVANCRSRQIREAREPGACVGERDHRAAVQISVGGHELRSYWALGANGVRIDAGEDETQVRRKESGGARIELRGSVRAGRSVHGRNHIASFALMQPPVRPHLLIIDAQSLAGRAAHVSADDVTNGVRLWCQMARGAALDVGASHIVAAWDHAGPTFRHTLYPLYKHRRTGGMRSRIAPIRMGVEACGVMSVSVMHFEGDDCVASLMARFRAESRVTLLSNDSDLLQFVSDDVQVATYVGAGKGVAGMRVKVWRSADVMARFGVLPTNLAAFKALCGEDGDDIPGVKQIGKETAATLLRRWQSLDRALEAIEFVGPKDDTAKLAGQHEHLRLMLQLTTIREDVPVPPIDLAQCDARAIRWPYGSQARRAEVVHRVHAGPGLEEVPFPES